MNSGSVFHINIGEVDHALGIIKSTGVLDPIDFGLIDIRKEILADRLGDIVKHNCSELVGRKFFLDWEKGINFVAFFFQGG